MIPKFSRFEVNLRKPRTFSLEFSDPIIKLEHFCWDGFIKVQKLVLSSPVFHTPPPPPPPLLVCHSPDEDYLLALDSTKWLQRVGELLSITNSVVNAITRHRAHVLVAFEYGWDRTTQVC